MMEKTFDPQRIEAHWADFWEAQGYYQPDSQASEPYAITLPPPNVTGTLHMGHGFQTTLMDALTRRQRMLGKKTLWQPGTDHAGIATQMVVERELGRDNLSRHDLGRENFIQRVWEWKAQSGSTITRQIRRLGASLDWSRERFSMDDDLNHATLTAFIQLHESGYIYRGKKLINWDPKLRTAISDLEVINQEKQGSLWHIHYPLSSGDGQLTVATTRPETMLGDTAVAVHPDDERYTHLIGQTIQLPLTNRTIPIIADDTVDQTFGTGCVKITPAHDFNDHDMGKRHDLPLITVLNLDGTMNDNAPAAYQGMDRFKARKQIVADLETQGWLAKVEPHTLQVPMGDRSGVVIEPMLTDQWFIRMESLAAPAIAALDKGELTLVPAVWNKTYLQWLDNIQDWCISRQLWWGHRIPAWYDDDNNIYVGLNEADVRKRNQLSDTLTLRQDDDVLDTWFTAALCPFSSLQWPHNEADVDTFYPNNVLVTGFDILFFWVARMVMLGIHFLGKVPFKEVYIHGLIRDSHGQKMSKSKGNVLDPIDLVDGIELEALIDKRCYGLMQPHMIDKVKKQTRKEFPDGIPAFGTDALRFTFCALASTGRDINFDMGRIEGYRNFCNKLWNATRFILMQLDGHTLDTNHLTPGATEHWLEATFQETLDKVERAFSQYRFDLLAQAVYDFTWNELCDWYLEFAKCQLNDANTPETVKNTIRVTLLTTLERLTRVLHPIIPYITEEIWQTIAPKLNINAPSIMLQPYPQADSNRADTADYHTIEWVKQVVNALRNVRGEMGISPAKAITVLHTEQDAAQTAQLQHYANLIQGLARVDHITAHHDTELPASAACVVQDLTLHIPLSGIIDKDQEISRLTKEMAKLTKELEKSQQKLANPNYVKKAPKTVVDQEQQKLTDVQSTLTQLQTQYERIAALD